MGNQLSNPDVISSSKVEQIVDIDPSLSLPNGNLVDGDETRLSDINIYSPLLRLGIDDYAPYSFEDFEKLLHARTFNFTRDNKRGFSVVEAVDIFDQTMSEFEFNPWFDKAANTLKSYFDKRRTGLSNMYGNLAPYFKTIHNEDAGYKKIILDPNFEDYNKKVLKYFVYEGLKTISTTELNKLLPIKDSKDLRSRSTLVTGIEIVPVFTDAGFKNDPDNHGITTFLSSNQQQGQRKINWKISLNNEGRYDIAEIFHEVAFAVLVNAAIDHDRGFEIKMRQILNTPIKKGLQENLGNLLQKVTKGRHNDLPDGYILKDDRITAQIKNAVPKNYYRMLRILDVMMLSGILGYNQ